MRWKNEQKNTHTNWFHKFSLFAIEWWIFMSEGCLPRRFTVAAKFHRMSHIKLTVYIFSNDIYFHRTITFEIEEVLEKATYIWNMKITKYNLKLSLKYDMKRPYSISMTKCFFFIIHYLFAIILFKLLLEILESRMQYFKTWYISDWKRKWKIKPYNLFSGCRTEWCISY